MLEHRIVRNIGYLENNLRKEVYVRVYAQFNAYSFDERPFVFLGDVL